MLVVLTEWIDPTGALLILSNDIIVVQYYQPSLQSILSAARSLTWDDRIQNGSYFG